MLLMAFSWLICLGCGIAIGWWVRGRKLVSVKGGETPLSANELPPVVVQAEFKYQVLSPKDGKMLRHYKGDNLSEVKQKRKLLRDRGTVACLYVNGENRG